MARNQIIRADDYGDDEDKAASTNKTLEMVGHSASGGHHNSIYYDLDGEDDGGYVPYEFVEYPKHVTVNGKLFVCNNEAEEETAKAGDPIIRDADERKRLAALAEVKGVNVDKRWSLDRMAKTITDAGFDASANPFE